MQCEMLKVVYSTCWTLKKRKVARIASVSVDFSSRSRHLSLFGRTKTGASAKGCEKGEALAPKFGPAKKAKNASNAPLLMESYNRTFAL